MIKKWIALIILIAISFECKGKAMDPLNVSYQLLRAVPKQKWDMLAQKKIYFGHQSVGQNIVEGLEKVLQNSSSIQLKISEMSDPGNFKESLFAHSRIGRNRDPQGKLDHFRQLLESGIGQATDIAFFKFCYVDIEQETNLGDLIDHYDKTLTLLKEKFPNLVIIPVTVPLTNLTPGIKAKIKRFLGLGSALKADNIKRNDFNDHIRKKYSETIWDLADIEATTANGTKITFRSGQRNFFLLNRAYTNDGGHLNAIGSQVVAIDLLLHLASLESD